MTELLSGDFNTAFGRSSHQEIWSEAMVAGPLLRGMTGITYADGGRELGLSPKLPAEWDSAAVRRGVVGEAGVDIEIARAPEAYEITVTGAAGRRLRVTPGLPRDAVVSAVTVDGAAVAFDTAALGDVRLVAVEVPTAGERAVIRYALARRGSDVAVRWEPAEPGAANGQVRVLRSVADEEGLTLLVEGRAGSEHALALVTDRAVEAVTGGRVDGTSLAVGFE